MIDPNLEYTCPHCTSWYTGKEPEVIKLCEPNTHDFTKTDYYCPYCASERDNLVLLSWAPNCHIITPHQEEQIEMVEGKLSTLYRVVEELEDELRNLRGGTND